MKLVNVFAIALALAAVAVGLVALNTAARHFGWITDRMNAGELSALLRPHDRIARPPGEGPFPTALLFSGCDGVHDNMERWSQMLVEKGWAAIVVDSHTPRGLDDFDLWRLVCVGQTLPGAERAGDVLVSLADARALPFVDPDRIALIGMSHGGWSLMDLAVLDLPRQHPLNLARLPEAPPEGQLAGVQAFVLVYPWCGLLNGARHAPWRHDAPVLFILATQDTIAPADECEAVARTMKEDGHDVTVVRYDDVTHGFDQQDHSVLSTLVFDPEITRQAMSAASDFLDRAIAPD